jgi:hypothetical protein
MTQIATTIEQSKRLIDAGLDPESADMTWQDSRIICKSYKSAVDFENEWRSCGGSPHIIHAPAWSLSRLIDIHGDFNYGPMNNGSEAVLDCIVNSIIANIEYKSGRIKEEYLAK